MSEIGLMLKICGDAPALRQISTGALTLRAITCAAVPARSGNVQLLYASSSSKPAYVDPNRGRVPPPPPLTEPPDLSPP